MKSDHTEKPICIRSLDTSAVNSLKKALLSSVYNHRYILAAAVTMLLPSTQAFAQCAPAPDAPVSIASGSCTDSGTPGTPTRSSNDATDVVGASGTGVYTGNVVELDASGTGSGAHASGGGTINLNGAPDGSGGYNTANVNTTGAGSHGLYADGGGKINGHGVLVTTGADGSYGIFATGTGSDVNVDSNGVTLPPNTGQQIAVTTGNNAYGAYAADGGTVEITGINAQQSGILTYGMGSSAFVAESGGQITLTGVSGFVSGEDTAGAFVSGAGSTIVTNASYINTYGNNSAGMSVADGGAATIHGGAVVTGNYHGTLISNSVVLLAQGTGSKITIDQGGSVTTYGAASAGAVAQGGAFIDFKGYGVFTYETGSTGAIADGTDGTGTASKVAISNAIVRTTGPSSAGVRATGGGAMSVIGGEITTGYKPGFDTSGGHYLASEIGKESNGAEAIGDGSTLTITDNKLTTTGDGAIGVAANAGGTATVAGGTIMTGGAPTANFTADGVRATGPGSSVTLTSSANGGTAVTTSGVDAMGLHAMQGGVVDATNANVKTSGAGAFGVLSEGSNSNVKLTASSVTTQAASGLSVNGGGQINTTGTAVAANGTGSSGILGTGDGAVMMTGGSLSATGDLITGMAGNVVANLTGVAPTTGSGIVVHAVGGTTSGSFTNMVLTGNVVGEGTARSNATLNGSTLTGAALNADNMTIDATSTWNMIASSTVNNTAGSTTENAGLIVFAPPVNGAYKTLTTSNFVGGAGGAAGTVVLNTYLGGDASPSDQIVIDGGTAIGQTGLVINNINGGGAATTDGIKVVNAIDGGTTTTNAFFLGNGDYATNDGQNAKVAGAYAYTLHRSPTSSGMDVYGDSYAANDWYLRSVLIDPIVPTGPETPRYQPGVPVYETYPNALQVLNRLPTLAQRTGNRYWGEQAPAETVFCKDPARNFRCTPTQDQNAYYQDGSTTIVGGTGVWGRIEGLHGRQQPDVTTSQSDYDYDMWNLQAGVDGQLYESDAGKLIGGITVHYGQVSTDVSSIFGNGNIDTTGYGFGGTLTWYGNNGFYLDAQGQVTWYDSNLYSNTLRRGLADGNDGFGYAMSLEAGRRIALNENWTLTPQAQLTWSSVDFDSFTDPYGARVSLDKGDSLKGRLGLTLGHERSWKDDDGQTSRAQFYSIVNLTNEFLDGTRVDVSGTKFYSRADRLTGGIGFGGTYSWANDKYTVYGEVSADTSLKNFADSYEVGGTLGLRVRF
ncbi:autotransporter outer membrane beta-barrel domain-containing protein [Agrobacterium pusense]|uniref:autotransporter outer membrane beta-barrel domain-containing protein n=1 Tax=Agrobacterium pusense TaxID=648995 RepID=UPI00156BCB47|nr:autotransporter outer membrane beta-barrel domain-containing protein [Agrobacterium pusense]QKJ94345.1 autotransporter outer membrane beta-barrel domain-containing protein [Agrobacterium pusense]